MNRKGDMVITSFNINSDRESVIGGSPETGQNVFGCFDWIYRVSTLNLFIIKKYLHCKSVWLDLSPAFSLMLSLVVYLVSVFAIVLIGGCSSLGLYNYIHRGVAKITDYHLDLLFTANGAFVGRLKWGNHWIHQNKSDYDILLTAEVLQQNEKTLYRRREFSLSPSQSHASIRDAPESGFYHPTGYRISRIVKNILMNYSAG